MVANLQQAKWDLNPQPLILETIALPIELLTLCLLIVHISRLTPSCPFFCCALRMSDAGDPPFRAALHMTDYQLAFFRPGNNPFEANSLIISRDILKNKLYTPLGLPVKTQRFL